jgi:hypothetical protein
MTIVPRPRPVVVSKLRVASPSRLELLPAQTKYIEFRVRSATGEPLPAKPAVTLLGPTDGKISSIAWTEFDWTSRELYRAGFALRAAADAPAGRNRTVKVRAVSGDASAELSFIVSIVSPPRIKTPLAIPAPLRMSLPDHVTLQPSRPAYIEIRVCTADSSPLKQEPSVELCTSVPLRSKLWTSSPFRSGQKDYRAGFVLTTETNDPVGEKLVRVIAHAGGGTVEKTLRVRIR